MVSEIQNNLNGILKDYEDKIVNSLSKNNNKSKHLIEEVKKEDQELLTFIKNINY